MTQLSVIDSSRSLYISSALLARILKITFGIRLPCPPLLCCEGNELKAVLCCVEVLLGADLAPGGWTNLKAPSGSFTYTALTQAPSIPPISMASRKVLLPACTNSSTSQGKAALPPLAAQEEEEGRKHRGGESTSGINWRALNASERTAELAETIARSRAFGRDYGAKVGDETYTAYLNTKPELLLGLFFLMQAAKHLSPVTFSLPLACRG